MNHAERVKELARKVACQYAEGFPIAETESELHAAIDAMQSALDDAVAKLAERDAEVERLQNMLFAAGAMEEAPCFCCGYNGPGYFQPEKHSCASRHHTLSEEVKGGE